MSIWVAAASRGFEWRRRCRPVWLAVLGGFATGCGSAIADEVNGRMLGRLVGWGRTVVPYLEPGTRFVAVSSGPEHSVALTDQGAVTGWGYSLLTPILPPFPLVDVVAVGAGTSFSVALLRDGSVKAWGINRNSVTNVPAGLTNVLAISVGELHTLALRADGTVAGWGNTADGRLSIPDGLSNVVSVAAGGRHSLVALADGSVRAWGYNLSGQVSVPESVTNAVSVAAGSRHSLALLEDGRVRTWRSFGGGSWPEAVIGMAGGEDVSYALSADGTLFGSAGTGVPSGLNGIAALGTGSAPGLAVRTTGDLAAWETDRIGVREYAQATNSYRGVVGFADATEEHTLAVTARGAVVGWHHGTGALPAIPSDLGEVVAAAPGRAFGLALKRDGTVVTWGDAGKPPVPPQLRDVARIAAGSSHGLALRSDGTVVGLGLAGNPAAEVPEGLTEVVAIAAGFSHSVAVRRDGSVVAWGKNDQGQTRVPTDVTNAVEVAAAANHVLVVLADGTCRGWGGGGMENALRISAEATNLVAVSSGIQHALGLRADGTVVVWGDTRSTGARVPDYVRDVVSISAGALSGDFAIRRPLGFSGVRVDPEAAVVRLTFPTFRGRGYTLQSSPDLGVGGWTDVVGGEVEGTGDEVTVGDSLFSPGEGGVRFFRLVQRF